MNPQIRVDVRIRRKLEAALQGYLNAIAGSWLSNNALVNFNSIQYSSISQLDIFLKVGAIPDPLNADLVFVPNLREDRHTGQRGSSFE